MKQILAALFCLTCLCYDTLAQTDPTSKILCGATASYFQQWGTDSSGYFLGTIVGMSPSSSLSTTTFTAPIEHCDTSSRFDLYFEDVNSATMDGFDDTTHVSSVALGATTLGAVRRYTFCQVIKYIESTFDFSLNVSPTNHIRVYVMRSFATSHHAPVGTGFAGQAVPSFNGTASGITGGYLNDYATGTGFTDPTPPTMYHAVVQINFDSIMTGTPHFVIPWENDISDTAMPSCLIDLASVLLHEMTHALGWYSFVSFPNLDTVIGCHCIYEGTDSVGLPITTPGWGIAPHEFTKLDTAIRAGTLPSAPTTKLIIYSGGVYSINPAAPAANYNYWQNGFAAPDNYPVFSGAHADTGQVGSYLSHLDDQVLSYTYRERISPGDRLGYVMEPEVTYGRLVRTYTKAEIQTLVRTLGYTYIGSPSATLTNHLPYSRKMGTLPLTPYNYGDFTEDSATIDYYTTNNTGDSVLIDIHDAAHFGTDLTDADGDTIMIDTTTIVNLRGCGIGGNNHAALRVLSNHSISYKPRRNFYGKAQLQFNVTDGKERGSLRVVTIEVLRGTNVSPSLDSGNYVCNGGFEEGSEIKIQGNPITEAIPNTYCYDLYGHENKWQGICFSDSHPYAFHSNRGVNPYNFSGTVVENSLILCNGVLDKGRDGLRTQTFPFFSGGTSYEGPMPVDSAGSRYQNFNFGGAESYYYLDTLVAHCNRYKLEFDIYKPTYYCPACSTAYFSVKFADHLNIASPAFNFILPGNAFRVASGSWVHDTVSFWYCGSNPSNILYLSDDSSRDYHIDNIKLTRYTDAPPPLSVTITPAVLSGCETKLAATVTNAACAVSYLWSGTHRTSVTAANDTVASTTSATYTVTVSDGCRTATATKRITYTPLSPISGPSSVCVGSAIFLSDTAAGGTWSGSTSVASVTSVGGVVGFAAGTITVTYTDAAACAYVTRTVTVIPLPPAISGTTHVCTGSTVTLSDATGGGVWSSGAPTIATVGSTGTVTGVAAGTAAITYTLPTGCFTSTTVTVNAYPPPITGAGSVCAGSAITLSDAVTGGTWSSGAIGIATAGSASGIVTGVSAGVARITYTPPSGCAITVTITVNAAPTGISGGTHVCVGGSTYLLCGGGSPACSSSDTSIAVASGYGVATVSGISAGIVTITFTLSDGCYITTPFTVNPLPAPITGPSGICLGTPVTFSDTSGTWSSSTPAIATVGTSTGVVTGVAAGTDTIRFTASSTGCTAIKSVTVYPAPATITGKLHVCRGGTDTLSDATGGGTWSATNSHAAIGSATGIVVGLSAGMDTIIYTVSTGCRTGTILQIFDTTCTPCSVFGNVFTPIGGSGVINSSYGAGNYYISNNVTVTGNDTFTNAIVLIAPGDTVYIDTNAFLSINNSHLFSQCNEWSGMMLKPGRTHSGRLYVTGQSLIENAKCAVYIPNAVTPASSTDYVFKSDAATFNRNMCGVYITHYNPAIAKYPFSIKNTVFTGRDLQTTNPHFPYQWPPTVGLGGFKNYWNPSDTFLAPYNINSPAPGLGYSYRGAGTFSGLPISYGIRLDSVGNNNNPSTAATGLAIPGQYYEITVGDVTVTDNNGNQNLFDNMMYGIYSVNSNLTSVNNAFTNLYASNFRAVGYTGPMGGDGIYSVETDDFANQNRLRVYTPAGSHYNNRFYDFNYAVEASNMFQVIGQSCFMINKYFGTITSAPVGSGGFYIKTAKYDTLDISYDTITNVTNAIAVGMAYDPTVRYAYSGGGGYGYRVTIPSQYMGFCNLSSNVIQPHPIWGASLADQHVNVGISYQNTITLPAMSVATVANGLNIKSNIIHDAYNGIMVNGYNAPKPFLPVTAYNTVHLRRWTSQRMQYGVNSTNTLNGWVYYNFVSGPYAATSLNDSMKAYYSSYNTGMDMGCNYDSLIGRGFEFFMTNTGTNWHDNKMYGNLKGFVLNGGVIGPQVNGGTTSSSKSMNDEWQGSWGGATGDTQTYVISASPTSSTFYVQSGVADMNPTVNGAFFAPFKYAFGSSILTALHPAGACSPISSPPPTDTGNLNDLIAKQHVDFVYNTVPNNWMAQFALWKAALLDSTVTDSSAIVAQFVHMADSVSRFKYITSIEAALNTGDLATANYLLSLDIDSMANTARDSATQVTVADDVSADYIVYNYQQFYSIYIDYVTGAMTSHDSIDILALAQLCPEQNGGVVFQARALYSNIFNDLSVFNDDSCIDVDTGYIAYRHSHNPQAGQDGMQQYRLFPNPNDGSFMLQQYLPENNTAEVKIYDAVGRMVYKSSLQFAGGRAGLNVGNYAPGLYLLEMKDDKNIIFRCKFVKQ